MQNKLETSFKKRNPFGVFALGFFTYGVYLFYWAVQTKHNIVRLGGSIPTSWLLLIPLVNIWWMWKYAEAVEDVTKGEIGKVFTFIMLIISLLGIPVLQSRYNDYN
jgi:hypothetical protein